MNPRQSVLIAMFLSLAIFIVANIPTSTVKTQVGALKQVPS